MTERSLDVEFIIVPLINFLYFLIKTIESKIQSRILNEGPQSVQKYLQSWLPEATAESNYFKKESDFRDSSSMQFTHLLIT